MCVTRKGLTTIMASSIHSSFCPRGNTVVDKIPWSAPASIWSWRSFEMKAFCHPFVFFESMTIFPQGLTLMHHLVVDVSAVLAFWHAANAVIRKGLAERFEEIDFSDFTQILGGLLEERPLHFLHL